MTSPFPPAEHAHAHGQVVNVPHAGDRRAAVPAWLMSLSAHTLILIAGLLFWRAPQAVIRSEPERAGGIVLVQQDARRETTYLSDPREREFDRPLEAISASGEQASEPFDTSPLAALPDDAAVESVTSSGISLPQAGDLPAARQGLVGTPTITAGGRARLPSSVDVAAVVAADAARLAAREPKGNPTQVSLFGSPAAVGRSFVFLIDRSKSMGGEGLNALAAAERQLIAALDGLTDEHLFQIAAYNERAHYMGERRMRAATAENKAEIHEYFVSLSAIGRTDHELALHTALRFEPDVIFLLSDGGEPGMTEGQHRTIQRLAANRTTIHGIQFGFGPLQESDPFMQRLAESTGGNFTYVDMN